MCHQTSGKFRVGRNELMIDFFARHQGPAEGYCRLCGEFRKLTVDHIPPKSCSNSGVYKITDLVNGEWTLKTKNGLTFRTICQKCNNERLGQLDQELSGFTKQAKAFVKSKAAGLKFSEGYKITISSRKIVQCIAGHLLAAYDSAENLKKELNHSNIPYLAGLHRLYEGQNIADFTAGVWLHEYPTTNIFPSGGTIVLMANDTPSMFSVLSFFPLGFMIIDRKYRPENIPFTRLRTDQEIMTIDLNTLKKHGPKYPLDNLVNEVVALNSIQAYTAEKIPRMYY